jgi:nitroimidazol reductase NimA-like FMN-containing flavoprotein (pyridoxamine 5'-phosphate oxidase superfamily)
MTDVLAATTVPLSPTNRSTPVRGKNRAVTDREALYDVLDNALICHLGLDVGHPIVLPTAFGYDLDGPDRGGSLYLHGSVASRTLSTSPGATVCVTLTIVDGLVAARSAFHHSMNYRSAVILGPARLVDDPAEKERALSLVVDHMIPGSTGRLRPHTRKELAATAVIAVPLHEASVKARAGGPVDEPEDYEAGGWAGHIPVRLVADEAVPDEQAEGAVPEPVRRRAAQLASR